MNCQQIIYTAATDPGADSPARASFDVRALSAGLSLDHARLTALASVAEGYPVDIDSVVDNAALRSNPGALEAFAPVYAFRRIDLPDSARPVYALSRTLYLGAGPGFWSGNDSSGPATPLDGANFISHIVVTEEWRDGVMLAMALERDGLWRPVDMADNILRLCATEGAETELAPLAVDIAKGPKRCGDAAAGSGAVRCLLEALLGRAVQQRIDGQRPGIVVKISRAESSSVVEMLASLPPQLTAGLFFTTSSGTMADIPDSYDLMVVDPAELATFNSGRHIVADLCEERIISPWPAATLLATLLDTLAACSDASAIDTLADWTMAGKFGNFAEFCERLAALTAATPALPFLPELLRPEIVDRLVRKARRKEIPGLQTRIAAAVDRMLAGNSSRSIARALAVEQTLYADGAPIAISPERIERLANLLFLRGSGSYLGRMIGEGNVDAVARLIDRRMCGPVDTFLTALGQSDSPEVWHRLLTHYFRGAYGENTVDMLDALVASPLSDDDCQGLILRLIPPEQPTAFISELVDWYGSRPEMIERLPRPIAAIAMAARRECFSRFIGPSTPLPIVALMAGPVTDYFMPRLRLNPNEAMVEIAEMAQTMTTPVFEALRVHQTLVGVWLDEVAKAPTENALAAIDAIKKLKLTLPDGRLDRMTSLQCVLMGRVPAKVAPETIHLAMHIPAGTPAYFGRLVKAWAAGGPDLSELKGVMKRERLCTADLIGRVIMAFWTSEARPVVEARRRYILAVNDGACWSDEERTAYINSLTDSDLVAILRGGDGLVGKLMRRWF